jgi:hypothetical protein
MVRKSYNAVIERNVEWSGDFATEPYEVGWSGEAIFFITALAGGSQAEARVQISADGMRWCDEGTVVRLPKAEGETTFCKVTGYGNWLRLSGTTASAAKVLVTLSLKE